MDVIRTKFTKDENIHREALERILKLLSFIIPEVGYFQGMNMISAFFYQLFDNNEEEAYYFMCAIEEQTKFKDFFKNDLKLLNTFFSAFEMLLKINIPEIYFHLKKYDVNPNYYCSPWFLTLFTSVVREFYAKDTSKFVILIFERFILDEYSSIFNVGFTVIKNHCDEILKVKDDILMDLMINKFGTFSLFKNENIQKGKELLIRCSYQITNEAVDKMINITKYEESNK